MSKTGIITAVLILGVILSGMGVYYIAIREETVDIELKERFEVGDEHTYVLDIYTPLHTITSITGTFEDPIFSLYAVPVPQNLNYEELEILIRDRVILETDDPIWTTYENIGVERISTAFGDRDCIVLYLKDETSERTFYIGETNNVIYRDETKLDGLLNVVLLEKSGFFIESEDELDIKDKEEIVVGDSVNIKIMRKVWLIIDAVNPAGETSPLTYDFVFFMNLTMSVTYDEILESAVLVMPDYVETKRVGTEIIDTSLGKVRCNVLNVVSEDLAGMKYYISNGVVVMAYSDKISLHWEETDLIIRK